MTHTPADNAPDAIDYLFVYGTLRSDSRSDSYRQFMAPHFTLVGRGTIAGRLYAIDYYPGLLPATQASDNVVGEVHAFTGGAAQLLEVDEYEGCAPHSPEPHLYTRSRVKVRMQDNSDMEAWAYFYNLPVDKAMWIRSGDFLDPL